ncbi:MAG: hypothetical protein SWH54_04490 [Thermodesulfobacteriota bacterium]|nr:hypothetical protein [Thermodesulfobacteriota bacterium]
MYEKIMKEAVSNIKSNTIKYFVTDPKSTRQMKKSQDASPNPRPMDRQILTAKSDLKKSFSGHTMLTIKKAAAIGTANDIKSIITLSFF